MASLSNAPTEVPKGSFDAIPAGWYKALIVEDEVKKTSAGTGSYIKAKIQIVEPGKFMNRVVFTNFNIENPNPEAVNIALRQLQDICKAVGVPWKPADTNVLHNKPLMVKLAVKEYQGNDQNEVKGFKACLPGSSTPQPAATGAVKRPSDWT
jgi:hypothetical protein